MQALSLPLKLETSREEHHLESHSLTPIVNDQDIIKNVELHIRVVEGSSEALCLPANLMPEELIERGRSHTLFRAIETNTGEHVAIKKRARVFPTGMAEELLSEQQNTDPTCMRVPKRVLREMLVLTHLHHPHIVNLKSLVPPSSFREFGDVLFVLDFVETNLRDLLDADRKSIRASAQFIMFQLLSALNYIHSANVVHGDIRPERIAMDSNCNIKVGEIAITYVEDDKGVTDFSSKFWYRAPEILDSHDPEKVSNKMDVWAAGCVLAEILGGEVLFRSSKTIQEAVERQQNVTNELETLLTGVDPEAVDLIKKLLVCDPAERISAAEALRHPWLSKFVGSESEVLADEKYTDRASLFNDVKSIKREAFDTILEFQHIVRRATTPLQRISSPVERAELLKRMQLRLNSPAVETSQRDLISSITHNVENNPHLIEENREEGFISPREKKKSLMERMRDLFSKR